jgi:hypothetical protein
MSGLWSLDCGRDFESIACGKKLESWKGVIENNKKAAPAACIAVKNGSVGDTPAFTRFFFVAAGRPPPLGAAARLLSSTESLYTFRSNFAKK